MPITFSKTFSSASVLKAIEETREKYKHHFFQLQKLKILSSFFVFFFLVKHHKFASVISICLLFLITFISLLPCHPHQLCPPDFLLSEASNYLHCFPFTQSSLGKALFPSLLVPEKFLLGWLRGSNFVGKLCPRTDLESTFAEQVLCFCLVLFYLGWFEKSRCAN